jgi:hypothetical protein
MKKQFLILVASLAFIFMSVGEKAVAAKAKPVCYTIKGHTYCTNPDPIYPSYSDNGYYPIYPHWNGPNFP